MNAPLKADPLRASEYPALPIIDSFREERRQGSVLGSSDAGSAVRLGADVEGQIAIDNGALRFQPLITPGWGRQGLAYGPFRRSAGLVLAVSVTNGHNTSQGSAIPEMFIKRLARWALGPNADPLPGRLVAWLRGPRRRGTLRRFLWWFKTSKPIYRLADQNENLAIGWFTSKAPLNPLSDGCAFVMHAAEGDNGELWTRFGDRCLSAFRKLKNIRVHYIVVLRDRGAIYYAAATEGAHALPAYPMMRPIAIDPFNSDEILYAGVHQCVLGQIGFRVDTRVHRVQIDRVWELATRHGTAHAAAAPAGGLRPETQADVGGAWRLLPTHGPLSAGKSRGRIALLDPAAPSGLIHAIVETTEVLGEAGLAWRVRDEDNFWLLKISGNGCQLVRCEGGVEHLVSSDPKRALLSPGRAYSIQVLDTGEQISCYLDGERLFDGWFEEGALANACGVGLWQPEQGGTSVTEFEAHPRAVAIPPSLQLEPAWSRLGTKTVVADDFSDSAGGLEGRAPTNGPGSWERTIGRGRIELDGCGNARVSASVDNPHQGRTFYTLPWSQPDFADLEVTITPPGTGRGQQHFCRVGFVFWQDPHNYHSFSAYLDDSYNGASVALFPKRHGFEELYDAIWTMVSDKIVWGKPFRFRVAFDGVRFNVFVDGEPVMQRAMTDHYPADPAFRIARVGLAVNWEWGRDTGSTFGSFRARA